MYRSTDSTRPGTATGIGTLVDGDVTSTSTLRSITVFAPVPEDVRKDLGARLATLDEGRSPFADVPGTHFARLAVIGREEFDPQPRPVGMRKWPLLLDRLVHGGRPQEPDPLPDSYLLFTANYDGRGKRDDDVAYLEGLRTRLRTTADEIWGACTDYPGWSEREQFLAWFTSRQVRTRYLFTSADRQPTVAAIRRALHLRRAVIDAAVGTDGLPDHELVRRLREVFGPEGTGRLPQVGNDHQDGLTGHTNLTHLTREPTDGPSAQRIGHGTTRNDPHPAYGCEAAQPQLLAPETGKDVLSLLQLGRTRSDPELEDVQNLVTSGYPRHLEGLHLLLRVRDAAAARKWLTRIADEIPTAGWARNYVDRLEFAGDGRTQLPAPEGRSTAPEIAVHVAFSYGGLTRLGLEDGELAGFSAEFRAGMAAREPGLTPGRSTSTWTSPWEPGQAGRTEVDVLVMYSALDRGRLDADLRDRPWLRPGYRDGLDLLGEIDVNRIREDLHGPGDSTAKPGFLEHFGFVDGLSQPRVHGVTAGRRAAELPAGEALLGYPDIDGDIAGAGLPIDLARNGSYLVYRKLEQDVPAFRRLISELGERLKGRTQRGTDPRELAAAKLMGRWRDGTPLTLAPEAKDGTLPRVGFGYQEKDADGSHCPVGAHVRRVNPRDSCPVAHDTGDTGAMNGGLEETLATRHRMLRRGIPYGPVLPEDMLDDDEERGLLFIALVGDLRRQFEFVQAHWMADGNAFRLGTDRDPFSGASDEGSKFVVQGDPPVFARPSEPLVTCRGGEYFFLPGIRGLRRIAEAGRPSPPGCD